MIDTPTLRVTAMRDAQEMMCGRGRHLNAAEAREVLELAKEISQFYENKPEAKLSVVSPNIKRG